MKKRVLMVSAALALTVAGLAYATGAYSWLIYGSTTSRIWGNNAQEIVLDPSGTAYSYANKCWLYLDYYPGTSFALMSTDENSARRARMGVQRHNTGINNDDASAWMESSGGAQVKTWPDGKATMSGGMGAQVETSANGDVVITLGQ